MNKNSPWVQSQNEQGHVGQYKKVWVLVIGVLKAKKRVQSIKNI